ncbi:TetR/AcrR family transcriptional regulator [Nonomuraea sp. NPDC049400]|uniref:TetR/AcrR family transcriptional regulator n=1 Tax=Nonomuraea sp. NPDC049400 TaxID=3364352 RepID=UPI0037ABA28A
MGEEVMSLRERQRLMTQRTIQQHAMRLFLERGYDETTVNDVARAAGVSSMTVYRHFPTKEDLVLSDEYDPLIVQRIAAQPAEEPLMRRIGATLVAEVGKVVSADRGSDDNSSEHGVVAPAGKELLLARLRLVLATPALRARRWDSQYATQKAIVEALRGDPPDPDLEFRLWVAAGACLAAVSAALLRWAEENGRPDLPQLMTQALTIVSERQR